MLDLVLEALDGATGDLRAVATACDLNYDWVLKVKQGRIREPSVTKIQRLYDHFYPPRS